MKPKECNYKHSNLIPMCNLMRMTCGKVQHCPMTNSEFKKILLETIKENKNEDSEEA